MMEGSKSQFFAQLTWEDLQKWAGNDIVIRGKTYQKDGSVHDLGITPSGALIATVQGTLSYTTMVDVENGRLSSQCTCPYEISCKHAIATVIEFLNSLKKGTTVPAVADGDHRLNLLLKRMNFGDIGFSEFQNGKTVSDHTVSEAKKTRFDIDEYLGKQTREQLINLVKSIASRYPEVTDMLRDEKHLALGEVDTLVSSIRDRINSLMPLHGWDHDWDYGYGSREDFSEVRERLVGLLEGGHADSLIELGRDLLETGKRLEENSNDEWATGYEITECLEIVMKALSGSSRSPADRMLWMIDAELFDEYSLMPDTKDFWAEHRDASEWSLFADALLSRINGAVFRENNLQTFPEYRRDYITDHIILALEKSNRLSEIVPLCRDEALRTGSYERLAQWLIKTDQLGEAEEWLKKGIADTILSKPGIASGLHEMLCGVEEKKGDWFFLASLRGDDFFYRPGSDSLSMLLSASGKAGIQSEMKDAAMHYLETGVVLRIGDKPKNKKNEPIWPLPESGLADTERSGPRSFPLTESLMDIAIAEKKPSEVLRWYELYTGRKNNSLDFRYLYTNWDSRVAEAVSFAYPDKAITIWKGISEGLIGETKPKSYETASIYLAKIRNLLSGQGRIEEWDQYLRKIKESNRRKQRLLQVLDTIASGKIIDT